MASGKASSADLASGEEKLIEFHVVVAIRARNWSAAGEIVVYERTDNRLFKLFFEMDDVKRESEMLGDSARIVDVVYGAAAVLRRACALQLGQTALVPELHGETDNWLAALGEDGRDCGAVHTAAHGYGNGVCGQRNGLRRAGFHCGWRRSHGIKGAHLAVTTAGAFEEGDSARSLSTTPGITLKA